MTVTTGNLIIELADAESDSSVQIITPKGTFLINVGLSPTDGALVVFINTDEVDPTPDVLRVNVNEGGVFNFADAGNWYGEELGYAAPSFLAGYEATS